MAAKETTRVKESAEVKRVQASPIRHVRIGCSECGSEVDIVELTDDDSGLVEKILKKDVPDRPEETYKCPKGHDKGLEVL